MLWVGGLWMAVEVLSRQFPASRFNFQQDAEVMAGGSYTFSGGYWVAALFPLNIKPLYLPLVIRQ